MNGALPPWRRGLPENLGAQALPAILLYQRLYQAVHGLKGGLEMTDSTNPALPLVHQCLIALRALAEGQGTLPPQALDDLQKLMDAPEKGHWAQLLALLRATIPLGAVDTTALQGWEQKHRALDPRVKVDPLMAARCAFAAERGWELHGYSRRATLVELESTDAALEGQFLNEGGLLVSRTLAALTPSAKSISVYSVDLRYVGALPPGRGISG